MSSPTPQYFSLTGDPLIDGATHGYYWGLTGDRTVDWSLSKGWSGVGWRDPTGVQPGIELMLSTFSYFAGIEFNYVGYYDDPEDAYLAGSEINFAWEGGWFFPSDLVWALGFFPKPLAEADLYDGEAGDIYLNAASQAAESSYTQGSAGWLLFLHEIGHALGLKHPHDDGGTGRPTLADMGLGDMDIDWATIMSYNDSFNWNLHQWDPASPMILDVLALQYLYGKNMATNAGDSFFRMTRSGTYLTLWDAGGEDTVSAAGQPEGWMIVLPSFQLSTLVDTPAGFAIPLDDMEGTAGPTTLYWLAGDLEIAYGSHYSDVLYGSESDNSLTGNAGDDLLAGLGGNDFVNGGAGSDTAEYAASIGQFTVTHGAGTTFTVVDQTGVEGSDTLFDVERLVFADKTVNLTVAAAAAQVSAATLQSIVELYIAFFNRVPDSDGMSYWLGQAAAGVTVTDIANSFYLSAVQYAAVTGYSPDMTNADFVTVVYRNVLGRTSVDEGGLAYWSGALADGSETRGTLVKAILDSAHTFIGHSTYGYVADLLDNKFEVGKLFSVDLGLGFNTPEESILEGMRIAAAVTASSTEAAIELIGVSTAAIAL